MRVQRRSPSIVSIGPSTGGALVWNETRRQMEAAPGAPVYTGPALIGPASASAREVASIEDDVSVRAYEIQLDLDHEGTGAVTGGHVVTVETSPDPLLIGRALSVNTVDRGDPQRPRVVATLND